MRIAGAGRIVASVGRIGQGALEQSAPKKSEDSASQHQSPCFHFSRSIPLPLPLSPSPSPLLFSRLVVVVVVVFLFTRSSRYQLISRRVDDPNARVSTYPPRYIFDPGVAKSTRSKKNSTLKSPVSVGGLTRHAPLCNSVGHIATGINHFPSSQAVSPLVIRAVVAR